MPLPKRLPARLLRPKPKVKRAPRGTGSVFYSKRRKLWIARVPVGRLPGGRTRYSEVSATTQADAIARRKAIEPPGPETTMREWAERWYSSLSIRPSSLGDYRNTLDHYILPSFGHRKVTDITSHDVEVATVAWAARLKSANTLRKNLHHLRACFSAARRAKLIPDNPAADAKMPRAKKVVISTFTLAQLESIILEGGKRAADAPFALLAAIGCRIGEACGLDVPDLSGSRLSISRTYCRPHGLRRAKSEYSIRTVTVPEQALVALHKAIGKRKAGPVFASSGTRDEPDKLRKRWATFLRRLGLPYRSPHTLRHSVATVLDAAGDSVADIAAHLGDTVETIARTYLHQAGTDPGVTMQGLLGGGKRGRSVADGKADVAKVPAKQGKRARAG